MYFKDYLLSGDQLCRSKNPGVLFNFRILKALIVSSHSYSISSYYDHRGNDSEGIPCHVYGGENIFSIG